MDLDPVAGDALDEEPFQWIALVATESDPQLVGGQVDAPFADGVFRREIALDDLAAGIAGEVAEDFDQVLARLGDFRLEGLEGLSRSPLRARSARASAWARFSSVSA